MTKTQKSVVFMFSFIWISKEEDTKAMEELRVRDGKELGEVARTKRMFVRARERKRCSR